MKWPVHYRSIYLWPHQSLLIYLNLSLIATRKHYPFDLSNEILLHSLVRIIYVHLCVCTIWHLKDLLSSITKLLNSAQQCFYYSFWKRLTYDLQLHNDSSLCYSEMSDCDKAIKWIWPEVLAGRFFLLPLLISSFFLPLFFSIRFFSFSDFFFYLLLQFSLQIISANYRTSNFYQLVYPVRRDEVSSRTRDIKWRIMRIHYYLLSFCWCFFLSLFRDEHWQ